MFGDTSGFDFWRPWLEKRCRESVGVYWQESVLFFVRLTCCEGRWSIDRRERLEFPLAEDEDKEALVAEKVTACCQTWGWSRENVSLCLPTEEAFLLEVRLPGSLEAEVAEAVRWEIDGQDPFGGRAFCSDFAACPEKDTYLTASVPEPRVMRLQELYRRNDVFLQCLTVMTAQEELPLDFQENEINEEGVVFALHAALAGVSYGGRHYFDFMPEREVERWDWKRLSIIVATLVFLAVVAVGSVDGWRCYSASQSLQGQQAQHALMHGEREKKHLAEQAERRIAVRDRAVQSLSEGVFPWRSVLIHFGMMTIDGVWIESLELEGDGALLLRGQAVTYDALAEFLQKFESDRDFFREAPVLLQAETNQKQKEDASQVAFSLRMRL